MSAIPYFVVSCDVEQCVEEADRWANTAANSRGNASDLGWHRSGGKDVCPSCWDAGWRFGRDGWTLG